jgi:hypothetical protein
VVKNLGGIDMRKRTRKSRPKHGTAATIASLRQQVQDQKQANVILAGELHAAKNSGSVSQTPAQPAVPKISDEPPFVVGADGDIDYHPGLAEWTKQDWWQYPGGAYLPHAFPIYEDLGEHRRGLHIATITVNKAFSVPDARRIADLMLAAPELWRALRDAVQFSDEDIEQVGRQAAAVRKLFAAAGFHPFDPPDLRSDDELSVWRMKKFSELERAKLDAGKTAGKGGAQ